MKPDLSLELANAFLETAGSYLGMTTTVSIVHNELDPHSKITQFETTILACKKKILHADREEIIATVQGLCQEHAQEATILLAQGNLDQLLELFAQKFLGQSSPSDPKLVINELNLIDMIDLRHKGTQVRSILLKHTPKSSLSWLQRWKSSQTPFLDLQKQLQLTLDLLECRILNDSASISENMIAHSSELYCFLYCVLRYAQLTQDTMLAITLNSVIDRLLFIIDPVLEAHTLKNQYLLYYHLSYELQELHRQVINDL